MLCYTEGAKFKFRVLPPWPNQSFNESVTYELGMVAYGCNLSTQGAEAAGFKHKAILNYRTKLTQRYRKRMIFPYGTFPLTIINSPAKRIRVEALSFPVYYNSNAGLQDLVVTGTSESLCTPNDAL